MNNITKPTASAKHRKTKGISNMDIPQIEKVGLLHFDGISATESTFMGPDRKQISLSPDLDTVVGTVHSDTTFTIGLKPDSIDSQLQVHLKLDDAGNAQLTPDNVGWTKMDQNVFMYSELDQNFSMHVLLSCDPDKLLEIIFVGTVPTEDEKTNPA